MAVSFEELQPYWRYFKIASTILLTVLVLLSGLVFYHYWELLGTEDQWKWYLSFSLFAFFLGSWLLLPLSFLVKSLVSSRQGNNSNSNS